MVLYIELITGGLIWSVSHARTMEVSSTLWPAGGAVTWAGRGTRLVHPLRPAPGRSPGRSRTSWGPAAAAQSLPADRDTQEQRFWSRWYRSDPVPPPQGVSYRRRRQSDGVGLHADTQPALTGAELQAWNRTRTRTVDSLREAWIGLLVDRRQQDAPTAPSLPLWVRKCPPGKQDQNLSWTFICSETFLKKYFYTYTSLKLSYTCFLISLLTIYFIDIILDFYRFILQP